METDRELLRLTSCHGSEGEGCAGVRVRKRSLGVCVCACVDQQCGVGVRVDLHFPPSGPFHQEVECVFRLLSFTNRRWQRRRPVSADGLSSRLSRSSAACAGEARGTPRPGPLDGNAGPEGPRGQPLTRPLSTSRRPSAPPDTTGSRGNAQSPRRITGIDRSFSATAFWGGLLHDQRWPTHTSEGMIPPVCACGQETGADTGRSTRGGQ